MRAIRAACMVTAVAMLFAACGSPATSAGSGGNSGSGGVGNRPTPDCTPTPGPGAGEGPDAPVASAPCGDPGGSGGKPKLVEPRPGMAGLRAVQWQNAQVSDDGTKVTLIFYSGVEPCSVLDHVDVEETDRRVVITMYEGSDPDEGNVACIEIAVLKATVVQLDAPLGDRNLVDGARGK